MKPLGIEEVCTSSYLFEVYVCSLAVFRGFEYKKTHYQLFTCNRRLGKYEHIVLTTVNKLNHEGDLEI